MLQVDNGEPGKAADVWNVKTGIGLCVTFGCCSVTWAWCACVKHADVRAGTVYGRPSHNSGRGVCRRWTRRSSLSGDCRSLIGLVVCRLLPFVGHRLPDLVGDAMSHKRAGQPEVAGSVQWPRQILHLDGDRVRTYSVRFIILFIVRHSILLFKTWL